MKIWTLTMKLERVKPSSNIASERCPFYLEV